MKKTILVLGVLAAALPLRADGLSDLRASLEKLPARSAVRAGVSIETRERSDEDAPPEIGKASFEAEHGPQGLRVTWAPDLIARVQLEARANEADPEAPTPARTAMRQLDPADLMESFDAASALARRLASATLVGDKRITLGGRPARQLTMSLEPKLSKVEKKRIKAFELTMVVNVDGENVPVSAELHQKVKAKFLLMSFDQESQRSWTYARAGDRLLSVRHHERATGSGMGQKFENAKTTILTLK